VISDDKTEHSEGIVAQSEKDFIDVIEKLILNKELRTQMSQMAITNANRFDKEKIFTKFWQKV